MHRRFRAELVEGTKGKKGFGFFNQNQNSLFIPSGNSLVAAFKHVEIDEEECDENGKAAIIVIEA